MDKIISDIYSNILNSHWNGYITWIIYINFRTTHSWYRNRIISTRRILNLAIGQIYLGPLDIPRTKIVLINYINSIIIYNSITLISRSSTYFIRTNLIRCFYITIINLLKIILKIILILLLLIYYYMYIDFIIIKFFI